MTHKFPILTISFLALSILLGCKKNDAPDFHTDYFGMEEGRYVIYDVMEVVHDNQNPFVKHDTTRYQLKTVWGEVYLDNEGREGKVFRRYTRNTASSPWTLKDVWSGLINGPRGELIEENQRVVKLIFAPTVSKEWDANAYNPQSELDCYYDEIHQPYTISNFNFDSTVTVEQADVPTAIDTLRMFEVYAKDIGLIKKVDRYIKLDGFASNVIDEGYELFYTYLSTGME